jgi:hypothetical protein
MAQIINLRMARKAAARTQSAADAATNRAKFGATKAERQARTMENDRLTRIVDGAKLDGDA